MAIPKSVVKFSKNGVEYVSNVDACQYTIRELTRAALRDVGKFLVREINKKAQTLPGMKKNRRVRGKTSAFGYWARKQECDLQIGVKHGTWYGEQQELGTKNQPKRAIMRDTTYDNIQKIIEIESKYLSGLTNEAERLLSDAKEDDYLGGEEGED